MSNPRRTSTKPIGLPNVIRQTASDSPPVTALRIAARDAASLSSPVMIVGETGKSQEPIARFIHDCSSRADHPFIPVDCSALFGESFERELFGQLKGSSPSANRDSLGCIRASSGGTLFLDSIEKLTPVLQTKLLCVLQEKAVVPIGGTVPHAVDLRIISSTTEALDSLVRTGMFRKDLYFYLTAASLNSVPASFRPIETPGGSEYLPAVQAQPFHMPQNDFSEPSTSVLSFGWAGNVGKFLDNSNRGFFQPWGESIHCSDLPTHLKKELDTLTVAACNRVEALKRRKNAAVHCETSKFN